MWLLILLGIRCLRGEAFLERAVHHPGLEGPLVPEVLLDLPCSAIEVIEPDVGAVTKRSECFVDALELPGLDDEPLLARG